MSRSILNLSLAIIHDDIKPQNVLIFKDSHGTYTSRVTDFEYSTWFASENDRIKLSISRSWNASEYDKRSVRSSQARNMNVFSFDMLCLWVLFERYLFGTTSIPQSAFWANELFAQTNDSYQSESVLNNLKHQKKLIIFAHTLLNAEAIIETKEKNALSQFFTFALSYDLDRRETSLQRLVNVLTSSR